MTVLIVRLQWCEVRHLRRPSQHLHISERPVGVQLYLNQCVRLGMLPGLPGDKGTTALH